MTITVKGPNVITVNFPDGTDQATIDKAMREATGQRTAAPAAPKGTMGGTVSQGMSGVNEGIGNLLGFPVDAMNSAVGLGMRGINAVAGTNLQPSEKPFL